MRTMARWWAALLASYLLPACVEGAAGPADPGCSEESDCLPDEFCRAGRCVVIGGEGGTGGQGGMGGQGGTGGEGGAPACLEDGDCASRLCLDDGTCCQQSCSDAACGELRCGRRCQAACLIELLGGATQADCDVEGWPSARNATPLAALGAGHFLLFSGDDPRIVGPDLWELVLVPDPGGPTHASWTPVAPAPGAAWPEARYGHVLVRLPDALCAALGAPEACVLLWGGRQRGVSAPGLLGTWLWSRSTGFVRLELPIEPSKRLYPAFAADPAGARLLFFGGWACADPGCAYEALDDTWSFDATGWHELAPPLRPNARGRAALAGPLPDGRLVLLGGRVPGELHPPIETLRPIWSFDGTEWRMLAEAAPLATLRQLPAAFWAPGAAELVVHGGFGVNPDDTEGAALGDTELLPLTGLAQSFPIGPTIEDARRYRASGWDPEVGLVVFGGATGVESYCELHRLWIR